MISVEEALRKIGDVDCLEEETVPILESLGQVLAEDIVADINVPPRNNAGMDGYAVLVRDTRGASQASPRRLRVIDTVMAGAVPRQEVTEGTAIRIMTGAPVPAGAEGVVPFEDTDEAARKAAGNGHAVTEVAILSEAKPGQNIRSAGGDIARGATVLRRGKVIRPAEIGLLGALGRSRVKVFRRPVVAVLATGDELVPPDQPLPEGKIYDSNTYSIAGLVKRYGGLPRILGIAGDSADAVTGSLRDLDADILLTIGGVSMGDFDVVKDFLAAEGEMTFWKVRVKPGKPLAFGWLKGRGGRRIPHFGLPGNPVSCMVNFELFVRPTLLRMMGKRHTAKPTVEAVMEEPVKNKSGRRLYNRAIVTRRDGRYYARLTGAQGSEVLTSMSLANGLVIIPEDKEETKKGETVRVMMLDWNEDTET